MNNLITIESAPAKFVVDFAGAKKELAKKLKKYDVVVTFDTVKDAKTLATDLNKQATELETSRKEAVYNVSAPIRAFEADMKHLVTMCKDGREKILCQVRKFEDETKREIKVLLTEKRGELWTENEVNQEFRSAKVDDLVILTNMTGKGALSAKARNELESRVRQDKQQQITIEMRLLQLENRCFKAGLNTPLTEVHVEAFLYAPEQEYNTRLDSLIYVEVKRQNDAEANRALKEARDASVAEAVAEVNEELKGVEATVSIGETVIGTATDISVEAGEISTEELDNAGEKLTGDPVARTKPKAGKVIWNAVVNFEVEVDARITREKIQNKLEALLNDAGITSYTSIEVSKNA